MHNLPPIWSVCSHCTSEIDREPVNVCPPFLDENITLDFIRIKLFVGFFLLLWRVSTRTLCNPQAASMTASEMSSAVFRKTSFTMRQRLTPAKACSTRTRICPNFRLVRFSAAVNSPPAGFFFRLAGFLDRRLVPLERAVLVQDRPGRIGDAFVLGDAFVGDLADVRAAQKGDAFAPQLHQDNVLVAVRPLPPAVVR